MTKPLFNDDTENLDSRKIVNLKNIELLDDKEEIVPAWIRYMPKDSLARKRTRESESSIIEPSLLLPMTSNSIKHSSNKFSPIAALKKLKTKKLAKESQPLPHSLIKNDLQASSNTNELCHLDEDASQAKKRRKYTSNTVVEASTLLSMFNISK